MDIVKRIRYLMDVRHMNQASLADSLGVSQPFLSQVLNGKKKLSLDLLLSVCKALELSPGEFFKSEEPEDEFHKEQERLMQNTSKLSLPELKALNVYIEELDTLRHAKKP